MRTATNRRWSSAWTKTTFARRWPAWRRAPGRRFSIRMKRRERRDGDDVLILVAAVGRRSVEPAPEDQARVCGSPDGRRNSGADARPDHYGAGEFQAVRAHR